MSIGKRFFLLQKTLIFDPQKVVKRIIFLCNQISVEQVAFLVSIFLNH